VLLVNLLAALNFADVILKIKKRLKNKKNVKNVKNVKKRDESLKNVKNVFYIYERSCRFGKENLEYLVPGTVGSKRRKQYVGPLIAKSIVDSRLPHRQVSDADATRQRCRQQR